MPFIAACPLCRASKFRVPSKMRGTFQTCPTCRQEFLLVPERPADSDDDFLLPPPGESDPTASDAGVGTADDLVPAPEPVAAVARPAVPEPVPVAPPADPVPNPVLFPPLPPAGPAPTPRPFVDNPLRLALAAAMLFGVGVVAGQLPYGRIIMAVLAVVGLGLGGLSLLGLETRRWLGRAGAGLNGVTLLVVAFAPGVFGLSDWWPPAPTTGIGPPLAVVKGGETVPAPEWLDAGRASWQHGDVRLSVFSAVIGPVELVDPGGRKRWTKEKYVQIVLRIKNNGVAREITARGFGGPGADAAAPRLTAADRGLGAKTFEAGWRPAARPEPHPLYPGKTSDYLLVFEPPPTAGVDMRLEVPGEGFGGTVPARLLLPSWFVGTVREPRKPTAP